MIEYKKWERELDSRSHLIFVNRFMQRSWIANQRIHFHR